MALDDTGDGLINYRPIISYLIKCLPSLSDRFPDEFEAVKRQILKSKHGKRGAISSIEERCKVADKDGNGRLSVKNFQSVMSRCGVKTSSDAVQLLADGIDSVGNGDVDYAELLDQLKGSHSYGREEWYEREASLAQRLRKAIWKEHGKRRGGSWQKDLRASFKRFDRDGDGVVNARDFNKAMQNLKIKVSRGDVDRLMELLDKNDDGCISYEDFVDFMVSSESDVDLADDGYDSEETGRGRSKRGGSRSNYSAVVGDYEERLSPRGGYSHGPRNSNSRSHSGSRSRSSNRAGRGKSGSAARAGRRQEPSKTGERHRELMRLRKKIIAAMDGRGGSASAKKMKKIFMDIDDADRGFVSTREFSQAMRKCNLASLSRADTKNLTTKFDTEGDGRVNWEEFVAFVFHPEKRTEHGGVRDRGSDDDSDFGEHSDSYDERNRNRDRDRDRERERDRDGGKASRSYKSTSRYGHTRSTRGGAGKNATRGGRPQSRRKAGRHMYSTSEDDDADSYSADSYNDGINVRGTRMQPGKKSSQRRF